MMSRPKDRLNARKRKSPLKRLVGVISFTMMISAVVQELSKPAAERT